jgi:hypothetical protein
MVSEAPLSAELELGKAPHAGFENSPFESEL